MDDTISVTSADDPRVDEYRELSEPTAHRAMERDGFFVSEGWVSIERLIESRHLIRSVLLSPSRVKRFRPFMGRQEFHDVPVYVADHDVMRRIVGFDLPRGVLVSAARRPSADIETLALTSSRLVVLDAFDDDQSVGAIARAARAFGVDGLILSPTCIDPYHRRTVRVSMGEILHMQVARLTADEWLEVPDLLHRSGFETWTIAPADTADAESIWDTTSPDRLAIVLGPERTTPSAGLQGSATHQVMIPMHPTHGSLSVGHTAAIVLAAVAHDSRR